MSPSMEPTRTEMDPSIGAVKAEFIRYKTLAERAFAQIPDEHLNSNLSEGINSVSTLIRHLAGNLKSRYTDFMVSGVDGEKSWRNRDGEFVETELSREELIALWNEGTKCFDDVLGRLKPADLGETVVIRGSEIRVNFALERSLAHFALHVGQIMMLCRHFTGPTYKTLTVLTGDQSGSDDAAVKW